MVIKVIHLFSKRLTLLLWLYHPCFIPASNS